MKRPLLLLVLLIGLASTPAAASSDWTLAWQEDVGPGYITTAPVIDGTNVFVRTSGFWTGEERPRVLALDNDGQMIWERTHPSTTQHDMSPLLLVSAGEGPCGAWPPMLLVGWANGDVEALNPDDGSLLWYANTTLRGWGVTGAMLVDDGHLVVPTRDGLIRLCMEDGAIDFEVVLDLAWRNGVVRTDDGYWSGDEQGTLWHTSFNGTVQGSWSLNGSIRHPPVSLGEVLLVHVQRPTDSSIIAFNPTNSSWEELIRSGPSPALPLSWGQGAVFADSHHITSIHCSTACTVVDQANGTVNGELLWVADGRFMAPVNSPDGGWLDFSVNETGFLKTYGVFSTPHDGYGTAAPGSSQALRAFGNDAGILMLYERSETPIETLSETTDSPAWGAFLVAGALFFVAWLSTQQRPRAAWRTLALLGLILAVLMLPDFAQEWNKTLSGEQESDPEATWNPSWPDEWLGTQVVVFEFEDQTVEVGGLVGHDDVLALTQAAALEDGMSVTVETTDLGAYISEFNGVAGSGWEYFLNGERGVLSVDSASVDSSVVLVWRLA
jgi:outer membrane protein assembly factor BamB